MQRKQCGLKRTTENSHSASGNGYNTDVNPLSLLSIAQVEVFKQQPAFYKDQATQLSSPLPPAFAHLIEMSSKQERKKTKAVFKYY